MAQPAPHLKPLSPRELCTLHLSLVTKIVRQLGRRLPEHISRDDLFSAGVLGLLEAAERFDVNAMTEFEHYAQVRVRGAMLDELRRADLMTRDARRDAKHLEAFMTKLHHQLGREASDDELAQALGLTLPALQQRLERLKGIRLLSYNDEHFTKSYQQTGIFERLVKDQLLRRLSQGIQTLSRREQTLLRLYYQEELNMREIGEVMDVGESRISQLLTRITLKLRRFLKDEDNK